MIVQAIGSTYEDYYGFTEKPFSLSANPKFLYRSETHGRTIDDLLAGIRRRDGLIVLTGDIGTGKTTLCRAALQQLDRTTFSAFVPDPFLSRDDLLKMLLIEFGVMSVDDLTNGRLKGTSRLDLSYPLYEFLRSLVPLEAFAVLIIDEAQNLPVPLLEEIRTLADLEGPEKLLQVVLVGQLEFHKKLKLRELRQLDQRVSVRCELKPLNSAAVAAYINHRITVAGGGRAVAEFSPEAVDLISDASCGVPRLVNVISDRALHRGHLARTYRINDELVRTALNDLGRGVGSTVAPPEERIPAVAEIEERNLEEDLSLDNIDLAHGAIAAPIVGQQASDRQAGHPRRRTRRLLAVAALFVVAVCGGLGLGLGLQHVRGELRHPISTPALPSRPASPFVASPLAPVEMPLDADASRL